MGTRVETAGSKFGGWWTAKTEDRYLHEFLDSEMGALWLAAQQLAMYPQTPSHNPFIPVGGPGIFGGTAPTSPAALNPFTVAAATGTPPAINVIPPGGRPSVFLTVMGALGILAKGVQQVRTLAGGARGAAT